MPRHVHPAMQARAALTAVALSIGSAGAVGAQGVPGEAASGGAMLPPLALTAPDALPVAPARPTPRLPVSPAAQDAATDDAAQGFGVATHLPGGTTTTRAAGPLVLHALRSEAPDAAASSSRGLGPRDTRERVTDTTAWPARATGVLLADFGGIESYCSAALIGPSSVLTAAHCVYDPGMGWARNARFLPGPDGLDVRPHGTWPVVAFHVPTGFLTAPTGDYARVVGYDVALVVLGAPVGEALGWFGYGPASESVRPDGHALLSYPGDKPSGTLWRAECLLSPLPQVPLLVAHLCPTFAGASGGPLFQPSGAPRIAAVNVAETPDHNLGVKIGPGYAAWLSELWQ